MVPWAEGMKFPPLKDNLNEETMGMMRSKDHGFFQLKFFDQMFPLPSEPYDLDACFPLKNSQMSFDWADKKTMI